MRLFVFPFLLACAAQAAGEGRSKADATDDACDGVPVEVTMNFPKRTIAVYTGSLLVDGVLTPSVRCQVTSEDGASTDYNGCCPSGWHPLTLTENAGLLCEED